eukprot:gene4435-8839_t
MFESFDIIDDTWEIKFRAGKGSFCELFLARNIHNNQLVAIKVKNEDIDTGVLKWEGEILKALKDEPRVPNIIQLVSQNDKQYLVMDYVSAEDMSKLRDRIRASSLSPIIPLIPAIHLAREMILCLEVLHKRGYVHRDVKPANFVRSSMNSTEYRIIDFGVAKQYIEIKNNEPKIKPERKDVDFRGTTVYASLKTHQRKDQCPRDDLCSVIYIFLDFLCGKLPWSEAAKVKDKPTVTALKEEYANNSKKWISWIEECYNDYK